jgi:hypothetical protein
MSISLWAKWKGEHGYYQGLVAKRDAWGNDKMSWQLAMEKSGSRVEFRSAEGASVGAQISTNVWTPIAVTYDQGTARFFVNGRQVEESHAVKLGAAQETTDYFNGSIDEVRFYSRVLTTDEIRDLAAAGGRKSNL